MTRKKKDAPLPPITANASGFLRFTGGATAETEPHVLASVSAWLDGASGADIVGLDGTAVARAIGAELSARLRAHLHTNATDRLFAGNAGYRAIVEEWRLFRADTSRAVRDALFVDVETLAGVGNFTANAAVESWKKHGLRAPFDPSVTEGWGLPQGFGEAERETLLDGAAALYADFVARTLAYHPTVETPPAPVVAGSIPTFTPFDLPPHTVGVNSNADDMLAEMIRAGAALARPSYGEETELLARHIPTFRAVLARVRETIERHTYTDKETRALLDAVAPQWLASSPSTANVKGRAKRGWLAEGATFWASSEWRAIYEARLADAERRNAETERRNEELQRERDELAARATKRPPSLGPGTVKQHTRHAAEYRRMIRALRKDNQLDADEEKAFLDQDPNPLRGDAMLAAAAMLTVAQQTGALRDVQAATVRVGHVQLDARIAIPRIPLEQLGRLMGFDRDGARMTTQERARVARAVGEMMQPRDIIVEMAVKNGNRFSRKVTHRKRTPLLDEQVTDTGEREWLIHPSLAIGYNTGAVFLDLSAWAAGLRATRRKELTDPMRWADVYLKRLALPGIMEAKRKKVPITAAGVEKNLTLSTLWDRFGFPSTMEAVRKKRGRKAVLSEIETHLAFCVGSRALLAWKPWLDAAGAVKGYTVRMPAPSGALADETETVLELPFTFSGGLE